MQWNINVFWCLMYPCGSIRFRKIFFSGSAYTLSKKLNVTAVNPRPSGNKVIEVRKKNIFLFIPTRLEYWAYMGTDLPSLKLSLWCHSQRKDIRYCFTCAQLFLFSFSSSKHLWCSCESWISVNLSITWYLVRISFWITLSYECSQKKNED